MASIISFACSNTKIIIITNVKTPLKKKSVSFFLSEHILSKLNYTRKQLLANNFVMPNPSFIHPKSSEQREKYINRTLPRIPILWHRNPHFTRNNKVQISNCLSKNAPPPSISHKRHVNSGDRDFLPSWSSRHRTGVSPRMRIDVVRRTDRSNERTSVARTTPPSSSRETINHLEEHSSPPSFAPSPPAHPLVEIARQPQDYWPNQRESTRPTDRQTSTSWR